jgi:serine/threonine protein kinase
MDRQPLDEEAIFNLARQIPSPEARAAYLGQVCDENEALRARVLALLAVHEQEKSLLAAPAPKAGGTVDEQPVREGIGMRIGPYKLLQQLGEGGMGVVCLAEQEQPVRRRVALKVIKAGMDSAQVIGRFEQERQALALMDHPHIAKVLDAGATDTGRPYFVMELVKGLPITKYCDQEQLTPRERLELFIPVCQAVQHAHQKGIIHRDLKPSNVLIALYDGKPVPKVIDFGVAKATGQRLTERSIFTEVGSLVGTLEYMAPEQAELNNLDIDTRADIYSLGVLLYELLTGSPPFTAKLLRSAAFTEMLRIIREVEPPKPSTKLSSSEELPAIAAKRKLEPKRLCKLVHGDLDWIVMKCLAKERNRRYETANGVASDIERYLHEEPVRAGPPGAGYQLRKFARRYKKPLAAAAVFVVLLLGGVVVSTLLAIRATRAEAQARAERDAAQEARERADRHFALAKEAVDKYLSKVTDNPKLTQADFHQLRKELLETALPFYQQFAEQESQDPELRAARGQAYRRLASLRHQMGDRETPVTDYQRALEILKPLVAEFPTVPPYRQALAESHSRFGSHLVRLGRQTEAEVQFRKALALLEPLLADFPTMSEYRAELGRSQNDLGLLLREVGQLPEAGHQLRQARAIREKLATDFPTVAAYQRDLAGSLNNLADILEVTGRRTEAIALYEQAIHYQRRALERDPQDDTSRRFLSIHHFSLGHLLS